MGIITLNKLDLSRPVKLVNPELGEEDIVFEIKNYNELTKRVYISPINMGGPLKPQELVSIMDIVNIEDSLNGN